MNIETIQTKSGKRYRGTIYVRGKRYRSPMKARKIEVIKWGEEINMGMRPDRVPSFKQAAEERHQKHTQLHCRPATVLKDEIMFKELFPIFGERRLDQLRTQDIEEHLVTLQKKGLSIATMKQRVTLIKAIYNWHIKRGVYVFNPCLAIQIKVKSPSPIHWTEKQARQFLEYTAGRYRTQNQWVHLLYSLALNTGCRWGEIIGLDWGKINLNKRHILIDQVFDEKAGRIERTTKSGKFRFVGINDTLYELLSTYTNNNPKGLVFINQNTKAIDRRNFRARQFNKDMKEAQVPRIRFHALRDSYATIFMSNGGSIYHLKELLGHSDLKMTMKYSHFHPDHATQHANVVNLGGEGKVIQVDFANKKSLG